LECSARGRVNPFEKYIGDLVNVISVFLFGIVMAIVLKVGKSLWGSIVAHSLNDFISVVLFRL
jgi:membrane protease YdiL (CAAX protease family)